LLIILKQKTIPMRTLLIPLRSFNPYTSGYVNRRFLDKSTRKLRKEQAMKDKRKFDPNWNKNKKAA